MESTTIKALTMMAIALPTMFGVILLFMGATKLIHKSFPVQEDCEDEETHISHTAGA